MQNAIDKKLKEMNETVADLKRSVNYCSDKIDNFESGLNVIEKRAGELEKNNHKPRRRESEA